MTKLSEAQEGCSFQQLNLMMTLAELLQCRLECPGNHTSLMREEQFFLLSSLGLTACPGSRILCLSVQKIPVLQKTTSHISGPWAICETTKCPTLNVYMCTPSL